MIYSAATPSTESDKSLLLISVFVITLHVILIALLAVFSPAPSPLIKQKEKLVVRTIKLESKPIAMAHLRKVPPAAIKEPEPIIAEIESEPAALTQSEPAPQPEFAPKLTPPPKSESQPTPLPKPKEKPKLVKKPVAKPMAKAPPKPETKPTSKPLVKTNEAVKPTPKKPTVQSPPPPDPKIVAAQKKKQELFARAQGALSKLNQKDQGTQGQQVSSLEKIKLPSQIGALEVDSLRFEEPASGLSARERNYRDELASRLKLLLKLPEYGLVKLKLTLAKSGKVTHVDILSSESAANRSYIQKALVSVCFPAFGDNFASEPTHTFQITLSSD